MTALTDFLEGKIIDHIFRTASFTKPTTLYVGLLTAATAPDAGTVTEVSGGSYARVAVNPLDANWAAPSAGNGTTSNVAAITFPAATADWGLVTNFGIFDASTAGNLLIHGVVSPTRNITNGSTPSFAAGALTIQIDN